MAALGLTRNDFAEMRELPPAEQNRAFCANELDAIVYSVSHPNGLIRDAILTCHGMLVAVSGPAIDRFKNSVISKVVVTNTLPLPSEKQIDKIEQLSIAKILAEAIDAVFEDNSVGEIFGGANQN